jgi:hypothetical protein
MRTASAAWIAAACLALAACGVDPYVELQIADPVLPFLVSGTDYDELWVEAAREGCEARETRYSAAPLPTTVTVLPGSCYRFRVDLRASAVKEGRRVAESRWIEAAFGESGGSVATATLADLPGRRELYASGFERGEPFGDRDSLPLILRGGIAGAIARTTTAAALIGERSALLSGTATIARARALARVAETNLVIAEGDELIYSLELAAGRELRAVGVELELSTGASAADLGIVDREQLPIAPGNDLGREPGIRRQWIADLSPAAGARLVGVLIGMTSMDRGAFAVRLDGVAVVRP